MASDYIFQVFLRVTIQNQIRIAQWVIVNKVVQFWPLCRLKAPLGLSLLRNRGILISEENKKSEPFSYREKVRIFIVWCDGRDSNPRPTDS